MAKKQNGDCNDKNCPTHGNLRLHGRTFAGRIISSKVHMSATVEWTTTRKIQKYERFEKRRTKVKAHNPPCINAKEGDDVLITECRPLSKTKKAVIVKILGKNLAAASKRQEIDSEKREVELKKQRKKEEEKENEAD